MGGSGQPYLYDSPARYSFVDPYNGFNPKAVSQASLVPPTPPRSRQEGPLLNFNKHPDSYLILPYGKTDTAPMHPKTSTRVNRARQVQMALRILQLVGAVGMLICVICIKGTADTEGWILRLPPSADILIVLYAIYHLCRRAKDRTPSSSASYHFFALFMDTGLIPFYIFTAMLGRAQAKQDPGTKGRWTSFFGTDQATNTVIQTAWIVAVMDAGLHLASLGLDLYLVIIFRKIANLPPDMNPLEDNLTSRRKNKHKYKSSEITLLNEKHHSELSTTTLSTSPGKRGSHLQDSPASVPNSRPISFMQSRNGEDVSFSPHNPKTAHMSREYNKSTQMYSQPNFGSSNVNFHQRNNSFAPPESPSRHASVMPSNPTSSKRGSAVSSLHSYEGSFYDNPHVDRVSKEEIQSDNWFVVGDDNDSPDDQHYNQQHPPSPQHKSRINNPINTARSSYQPVANHSPNPGTVLHPLGMNPPTPPPQPIAARLASSPLTNSRQSRPFHYDNDAAHAVPATYRHDRQEEDYYNDQEYDDRSRTMTSTVSAAMTTTSSKYSTDEPRASEESSSLGHNSSIIAGFSTGTAPKGRFYGDLAAAMRGVREQTVASPRPKSMVGSLHYTNSECGRSDMGSARTRPRSHLESVTGTVVRRPRRDDDEMLEVDEEEYDSGYQGGRVVSRSGADVMPEAGDLGYGRNRREVSGKVAEEGRAGHTGFFRGGLFFRKSSGVS